MTRDKEDQTTPGTTADRPRWEGPQETKPRGYKPADDRPEFDRDASGENLNDPSRTKSTDILRQGSDRDHRSDPLQSQSASQGQQNRVELIRRRAYEIWENEGRPAGREQENWDKAVQEIESEGSEESRGPAESDPAVGGKDELEK